MIIQEKVSEADKVKIPSDLEVDSLVAFIADDEFHCGIVKVSTSSKLVIQLKSELFVFDATSVVSVEEALKTLEKVPEFHNIKEGIFMSRILEYEGEFIREYVEVKDVEIRNRQLHSITVEFQNGEFVGECLTMDLSTWDELWGNLAGWEIEE